jgi:hypothetical protein
MKRLIATLLVLAGAGALLAPSTPAASPCTKSWDGGAGTFYGTDVANWSGDSYPGSGDVVCIDAFTGVRVELNGSLTIAGLRATHPVRITGSTTITDPTEDSALSDLHMAGGTLAGAVPLTVGALTWTGGSMSGAALTTITGHLQIAPGEYSHVSLTGGRDLRTTGTGAWVSGYLDVDGNSYISHAGSAFTLDGQGASAIQRNSVANGDAEPYLRIEPGAVASKSNGSGFSYLTLAVDNDGRLEGNTGELSLDGGSIGTPTGVYAGDGDGWVTFAGSLPHRLGAGASFTNVRVRSGSFGAADGTTVTGSGLELRGGAVGGPGTLSVGGTFLWAAGDLSGSGTTISTGDFQVDPGQYGHVWLKAGSRLRTTGTGTWANGYIHGEQDVVWENAGTIAMNAEGASSWDSNPAAGQAPPEIHNLAAGTLAKTSGTGWTEVNWPIDNDGVTRDDTGNLRFHGGSAGVSFGNTGATLDGGTFVLGDGARADGVTTSGTGFAAPVAGAVVTGDGGKLAGGGFAGAGELNFTGTLRWEGGEMKDTGLTRVSGRLEIDPGQYGHIYMRAGRRLRSEGTGAWSNGYLHGAENAVWENTGSFHANAEGASQLLSDPAPGQPGPTIHTLSGLFKKASGDGWTYIDWRLENDGAVGQDSGLLKFRGGGRDESSGNFGATLESGTWTVADGAKFDGARFESSGLASIKAGAITTSTGLTLAGGGIGGEGTLNVSGTLNWSGGEMRDGGLTRVLPSGHFNLDAGQYGHVYLQAGRRLRTDGTGAWANGYLHGRENAEWQNTGSFSANAEGASQMLSDPASGQPAPTLYTTAGIFKKTAGTGYTIIDWALENDGAVGQDTGSLRFRGGGRGVSTGTFGAALEAGVWNAGDGAKLDGAQIEGGRVDIPAGASATSTGMRITNGGIGGAGTLTVSGTLALDGGELRDAGLTRVTGTLSINPGQYGHTYLGKGRRLRAEGPGSWSNGYIHAAGDAVFEVAGAFAANAEGASEMLRDPAPAAGEDFPRVKVLAGASMVKKAGTGDTYVDWQLQNDGVTGQDSGALHFRGGGNATSTGKFGGTLEGGPAFTFGTGASLDGARVAGATINILDGVEVASGASVFSSGVIGGDGTLLIDGKMDWYGGEMRGSGYTIVKAGATLQLGGPEGYVSGSMASGRRLENLGTIDWRNGNITLGDRAVLDNRGLLSVNSAGGSIYPVNDSAEIVNTGTISKENATGVNYLGNIVNDGTIRATRGRLSLDDLTQTADGRLEIHVGGPDAAVDFGVISGSIVTRLAGTLKIVVDGGFVPSDGQTFSVLEGMYARSGDFSAVEGLDLGQGRTFTGAFDSYYYVLTAHIPARVEAPAESVSEPAPVAAAPVGRLVAIDDALVLRPGRILRLLANDTVVAGTRVELLSRPKGVSVRLDRRTGALRIRLGASKARVLKLRYRLVAPDGARSRTARVSIRVRR